MACNASFAMDGDDGGCNIEDIEETGETAVGENTDGVVKSWEDEAKT